MFEDHGQDEVDLTHDEAGARDGRDNVPSDGQLISDVANSDQLVDNNDNEAQPRDSEVDGDENEENATYGDEEGSQDPTEVDGNQEVANQVGVNEEEELKMKIVLYYHTLVSFKF